MVIHLLFKHRTIEIKALLEVEYETNCTIVQSPMFTN